MELKVLFLSCIFCDKFIFDVFSLVKSTTDCICWSVRSISLYSSIKLFSRSVESKELFLSNIFTQAYSAVL